MGRLVDQFLAACEEWVQQTGATIGDIKIVVLSKLGASTLDDAVDETIQPVINRLRKVTGEYKIADDVLIIGLIQAVERFFEHKSEHYGKSIEQHREMIKRREAIESDPLALEQEVKEANEWNTQKFGFGIYKDSLDFKRQTQAMKRDISSPEKQLEDLKRFRHWLTTWREVTAPILEFENLKQTDEEFYSF